MKTVMKKKKPFQLSEAEWIETEKRSERAKKNLNTLKTWKEIKQNLLSGRKQ